MTRTMDAAAVAEIRAKMDKWKTSRKARRRLAEVALNRPNLTPCGRAEWEKELA